jgi:uncharacterized protein
VKRRRSTISRTREAICDTSPLQYLHQVGLLQLLDKLYARVLVPLAVVTELLRGREGGIDLLHLERLPWITAESPEGLDKVPTAAELGAGEKEVLALAMQRPGSLVVLDDRLARSHAEALRLTVTGTLGILLRAKSEGLLPGVVPVLDKLHRLGFRLSSKTRTAVLKLASE